MRFPFHRKTQAFTLIEVTMALGIISSSILVLVGLLTTGLDSLRISSEQTTRTQILQSISEGLSVTRFANINAATLYFDDEGQPLQNSTGACYKADLSPEAPSLPGIAKEADIRAMQNHLVRINVAIGRADRPNAITSLYSLQIANQTGNALTP